MPSKKPTPTFADNLAALEQVIATLESSETSLEATMAEFEKGIGLVRTAQDELAKTEQKVQQLLAASDAEGEDEAAG
ncbi:exodeoxyribonuclease VII small subunit [Parahaliea mediterranea]|uniref:exodeoxyribonuclease VII small subunit n=1 Tax=Parahaliea mediterranea TaxID=651086 RepID=UPI000E2F16EF|nr:exodeoxyribonuclease VII small subunit [Parahaliea mediterranea]